jgi:hypothetical protein
MKRFWFVAIAIAVLAGLSLASFAGMAAWDHNPQGEFHDWNTGAVQWDTFGPLLVAWFVFPFLTVTLAAALIRLFIKFVRN